MIYAFKQVAGKTVKLFLILLVLPFFSSALISLDIPLSYKKMLHMKLTRSKIV